MKLLKILALLGSGDKQASGHMYTVLSDIIRKSETSSNIGNAVLYECICCISSIHPNTKLLDATIEATSKFLKVSFLKVAVKFNTCLPVKFKFFFTLCAFNIELKC